MLSKRNGRFTRTHMHLGVFIRVYIYIYMYTPVHDAETVQDRNNKSTAKVYGRLR